MLLQIEGVGNHKIDYKDHTTIQFDSLSSYLTIAKKAISKFANSFYSGLSKKMLADEEAISSVAHAIMMGDWRWSEDHKNEDGRLKTKYSYRNQCALWAIKSYITKSKKKLKYLDKMYSLDHTYRDNELSLYDSIEDPELSNPEDIAMRDEIKELKDELIAKIFSLKTISDRQKEYIKLYYIEGLTFAKIGQQYGVTREAVRQSVNKCIAALRGLLNVE